MLDYSFSVRLDVPAHLRGKTRYGCSAEDEWFVVHLLRHLSSVFQDLVIRWVEVRLWINSRENVADWVSAAVRYWIAVSVARMTPRERTRAMEITVRGRGRERERERRTLRHEIAYLRICMTQPLVVHAWPSFFLSCSLPRHPARHEDLHPLPEWYTS